MTTKFTQKDYTLYLRFYDKVLEIYKRGLKEIGEIEADTLWYQGAKKTLEHLWEEEGENLTPSDVDNIIHVLVNQLQKK